MNKSEIKQYVFDNLNSLLIPQGYYLVEKGLDPHYVLKRKDIVIYFFLNFKDNGQLAFSLINISIREIEDVIVNIGKPGFDLKSFEDNKKYFLSTVEDRLTKYPEKYYQGIGYDVESQDSLTWITSWLINYLKNDAQEFIDKYISLSNILIHMDKLESEGKYWHEGILQGGSEHLFRGLLVSKLCNDSKYSDKLRKVDKIFYDEPDEWIPYYERLKDELLLLQPKYNL